MQRLGQGHRLGIAKKVSAKVSAATAALTLAMTLALGGCSTGVLHGLDEQAANEALSALERAGITAEKVSDDGLQTAGYGLRVARGDATRALEVLRSQGLPRERRQGFAEVYGQPSLIPSGSEERARYLAATAGEIERTLETIDGVVAARVHLVPEEADPLALATLGAGGTAEGKPRVPARAAVLLKAARGQTPLSTADVQRLVAGSVPALEPAAVAVVVTAAPEIAPRGLGPLASVGPLRVTPSSRGPLIAVFATGLLVIALLAAMLLVTLRRRPPPPSA